MGSAVADRRAWPALAAVVCTAGLVWFGTGLTPWWPLLWLAPLPVLLVAPRRSWQSAAGIAFLAWLIGNLNMWHYEHDLLHIPLTGLASMLGALALVFALAVVLYRALLLRDAPWTALLAFPAAWVSFEYLLNLTSPHGTAGSLAYSELNFLPFLQLASLTGPWGMTFCVLLFPAALATAVHLYRPQQKQAIGKARRIMGVSCGAIALVLVFGAVRLAQGAPGQPVKVGLVASDRPENVDVADEGSATGRLFHAYADKAAMLAAQGAQVIVLPEKLGVTVDPDTRTTDAFFQSLADRTGAEIVVGLIRVSPPIKFNEARVYAPSSPVLSYDKHHLLPAFESKFQPGTTRTLMAEHSETWGVAICKDMDFTLLSRQYGKAGAGLMLVPAWDFNLDRFEHGHMSVMRGVESGFALARSAKQGYLTVSDNRGRILAETRSDAAPFAMLVADVPAVHDRTLYLLWGDWFAWLALATLLFALVQLFRLRRARLA